MFSQLIKKIPIPAILSVGGIMSQVTPKEAISNISQWIKAFNLPVPQWAYSPAVDDIMGILCLYGVLVWAILTFLDSRKRPIQIVFNLQNPNKHFWSIENIKNEHGQPIGGSYHEARVEIKNTSDKTIRNVVVTIENGGVSPSRPEKMIFDKMKETRCDIHPYTSVLAPVVRWPNPKIQPGMLADSSAQAYGPIKVTVSADEMKPVTKVFDFDYQTAQMLFERKA